MKFIYNEVLSNDILYVILNLLPMSWKGPWRNVTLPFLALRRFFSYTGLRVHDELWVIKRPWCRKALLLWSWIPNGSWMRWRKWWDVLECCSSLLRKTMEVGWRPEIYEPLESWTLMIDLHAPSGIFAYMMTVYSAYDTIAFGWYTCRTYCKYRYILSKEV